MKLLEALKGTAEFDGTTYTLDATIAPYAVIWTYDSLDRGVYTYIEYFADEDWATVDVEDMRSTVRRNLRNAKTSTCEEMDELEGGPWVIGCKLGRP